MVLVMTVISSLIVVPVLTYTISVFRAQNVQIDKARAVELARGGTWVAISNEGDLYDGCGGSMPSSLSGVSTSCDVLETTTLRQPEEVPYSVATVQANVGDGTRATVPPELSGALLPEQVYTNPNNVDVDPTAWAAWLTTPDWSALTAGGKVWLPQLPTQATSSSGNRDQMMLPGTMDPAYSECRVFFPGTFNSAITLDGPTFFTPGVYYFTQPITIQRGADVSVGGVGCTTVFEAIAGVPAVPDPLNISGLGGTFVLGGEARIVVDDSVGSGDISFTMNQRYVSDDESSVSASSSVSIITVNGAHAPFVGAEALGDDLLVNGVLAVPASTVDDPTDDPDDPAGDPLAATKGYSPSIHTPKLLPPEPPTNVQIEGWQDPTDPDCCKDSGTSFTDHGGFTVTWTASDDNGLPVSNYVATASPGGQTCSPTPSPDVDANGIPDLPLQTSCTISGLGDYDATGTRISHTVTVVASNAVGDSAPSDPSTCDLAGLSSCMDLRGTYPSSQEPALAVPAPPTAPTLTEYSDGLMVGWTPPTDDGGAPITGYTVLAAPSATAIPPAVGTAVSCTAWWDETECLLPITDPLSVGPYDIAIVANNAMGGSAPLNPSAAYTFTLGGSPAPTRTLQTNSFPVPSPVIDVQLTSSAVVDIDVAGYIAVPQGHVLIDAVDPAGKTVDLTGGMVAAQIRLGTAPSGLQVEFANPIAQKRVRLRSTATSGGYTAVSDAVLQVNRSGSVAINSWFVQ